MPTRKMTLSDLVQNMPPEATAAIQKSGLLGGASAVIGLFADPTWLTAFGVFIGGCASFVTVIFTIYKYAKAKKQ